MTSKHQLLIALLFSVTVTFAFRLSTPKLPGDRAPSTNRPNGYPDQHRLSSRLSSRLSTSRPSSYSLLATTGSVANENATGTKVQNEPIDYCPSNCTCLTPNSSINQIGDLQVSHSCLHLNLSAWTSRAQFRLYQQFHPFQLNQLKDFNLDYNNLTEVNENLILNSRHNQTIEQLSLSHNQLGRFPRLRQASSIKRLQLDHNELLYLNNSRAELYPLRALLSLHLNHNRIRLIRRHFMKLICSQLRYVDLSHNRLARLDDHLFVSCKQLEVLRLNRNRIGRLGANVFANLTNLLELDLSKNNLTNLTANDFRPLKSLKILNLSKNSLQSIENGTFQSLANLQTLNLNENNLIALDANFAAGLTSLKLLQLSNNQIRQIDVNWLECRGVVNLYLEHNQIDQIATATFKGLAALEKLYLDYNLISSIEKNAFQTNPNLIWLFLNDNYLNRLVDANRTLFVHQRLQYIALENNHLSRIPASLFTGLPTLVTIDLGLNPIRHIEENALKPLSKLDEFNWDSKAINCDCSMKWFSSYYQEKSIENIYLEDLECESPKNLNGKLFIDVNVFLCKDDYRHQFIREPKRYQLIGQGKQFYLKCKVITNSYLNEDIVFEWRKNNRTLSLNDERQIVEVMNLDKDKDYSSNHKLIYSSYLRFVNASVKDEGDYHCLANNSYASIQSQAAQVQISKAPQFIQQVDYKAHGLVSSSLKIQTDANEASNSQISENPPENASDLQRTAHLKVRLGRDIHIDCSVTGSPQPKISLHKNGNLNFIPSIKHRIQFDKFKQQFIIKNATLDDHGKFACIATNELGKATKNVTVDVLSPPMFVATAKMVNQSEYSEGETILINCYAKANPKAEIMWKKNELRLETDANDRYYLKSDNQVLIIKNSRQSDSGVYLCLAKNELGIISSFRRVEILNSEQAKISYLYSNWHLIVMLVLLLVCLIFFAKMLSTCLFKKLIRCLSGTKKPNDSEKKNKQCPKKEGNQIYKPQSKNRSPNGQLKRIDQPANQEQNENLLKSNESDLKCLDFSSKYLAKNDLDSLTRLISYKKVQNSLDNLNFARHSSNLIKTPVKKVQFEMDS